MIVIRHRVNTARELLATPPELGVEIDLREAGADIVVQHDPFAGGERFVDWLAHYRHRFLILNVKSEGVEEPAVRLAA
ncbi:MAG TPA: hypothetical protein VEA38_02810, partial [Terriglobales bacterium]|nr:hypothetical protein [Terriglobales bacterium]